jgi:CheY-like chemotaxis protein
MSQRQLRLIVVEDHAESADGLKKFLTAVGYKVFVATDMTSALSLASAVEFDVLLSDLALPDGSGWELLKQLSAERRIRAIAFSGHNSPADLQRSEEAGFLEHIPKPLCPERLCAAIDRAASAGESVMERRW